MSNPLSSITTRKNPPKPSHNLFRPNPKFLVRSSKFSVLQTQIITLNFYHQHSVCGTIVNHLSGLQFSIPKNPRPHFLTSLGTWEKHHNPITLFSIIILWLVHHSLGSSWPQIVLYPIFYFLTSPLKSPMVYVYETHVTFSINVMFGLCIP